ncbi:MAG: hypothetical protein Q7K44_02800 [Candidatus Liptonbacteria bacterium]|nr:hypothetical protein [Candidatus Liptonbacteria bacterium]
MKKFNATAAVIFFVLWGWTIFLEVEDDVSFDFEMLVFRAIVFFVLLVILVFDRLAGEHKYLSPLGSFLWSGYWGLGAFMFFQIAALYAFAVGFGHNGSENELVAELYMYGFLAASLLYALLGLANLVKFFYKLFILPKYDANQN